MTVADIFASLDYGPAPEGRSEALGWIEEHNGRFGLFIGGGWQEPRSGEYFDVVNPAAGVTLARAAQGGEEDIQAAVTAAADAFSRWSAMPGHARARYLYALARQVQRHARFLAVLESLDNGKPIRESRDIDVPLVARHLYYHAGWAQILGQEFPDYHPLGVVGQIIPWNFPLLMLAWKIAPALAAGNTVVLKPAEFTPLTALAFAEIVERAGLPPGVVNIVTGDGRTGELLVRHPDVVKIAFTGSTEVGRVIRRETAGSGKKLSLELGGKSPFIVFDDADLDSVVEGVVDAIWFNQGQVCCAGSRLLVQEGIHDRLIGKLRARMERLRMGDPLDKAVDIGAIVAPVQLQRIQDLVTRGVEEGAVVWQPSWSCPEEGYFYPPTLCTNVSPASTLAQVEIFGPVLIALTFRTPDEAVTLANNTRYGLAASVWTEDVNVAFDVARQIKAGTIWINATNLFDAASGFGGYRESGYGREGGKEGLYEYLERSIPELNGETGEPRRTVSARKDSRNAFASPPIDRTPKMYVGGKQARPDSGYTRLIRRPDGSLAGEVGDGNRKDIRNAVEAAGRASSWQTASGHQRAQILYYLAENLAVRAEETARRLADVAGDHQDRARHDVEASIDRLFAAAAWADKFDGLVHHTPHRVVALAVNEPLGILGIVCPDEAPLLACVSLFAPAVAMGNAVVLLPSERNPLAATDLYQVLDTSDVPAGVVNIVTGDRTILGAVLADHEDVQGIWYFGPPQGRARIEAGSATNMKRVWVPEVEHVDWHAARWAESRELLRECTQVKNIWTPYGA